MKELPPAYLIKRELENYPFIDSTYNIGKIIDLLRESQKGKTVTRTIIYHYLFSQALPTQDSILNKIGKTPTKKTSINRLINGSASHKDKSMIENDLILKSKFTRKKVYLYPNFALFLMLAICSKNKSIYDTLNTNLLSQLIKKYYPLGKVLHNHYFNDPIVRQILFDEGGVLPAVKEKNYYSSLKNKFYNKSLLEKLDYINSTASNFQEIKTKDALTKQIKALVDKYGDVKVKLAIRKILVGFDIPQTNELFEFFITINTTNTLQNK